MTPVSSKFGIALIAIVLLAAFPRAAAHNVTLRTDDGITIAATWYEPSLRPAPAVIFVHMLGRTRRDWDDVASRLAAEGIGALTIDLRGHGESSGPAAVEGGYAAFVADLAAARRYVASRPDVLPVRIGFCGASIGASLVAIEAAQAPGLVSIALLSPSTEYRGLRTDAALRKYPGRALFVYSDDDGYAQRSARELIKIGSAGGARNNPAGGGQREILALSHAGHGTTMLARDPDLTRALVDWFRRTL